jgi:RNA polymerase subunit RPABC4/transcription elongation factor Spt4
MPVLQCPNCHRPVKEGARFCHVCGASLTERRCPSCHATIEQDDLFCSACGARLTTAASSMPDAGVTAPQSSPPPQSSPVSSAQEDPQSVASNATQSREQVKTASEFQTGAVPSAEQTPARPTGNWHQFKNAWYGFTLEKPIEWYARTFSGVTTVAPDAEGYVGVIIRQLQVSKGTSAETLARHIVGAIRKVLPSLTAWSDPRAEGEASAPNMLVMRYQGMYKNVALAGVFVIRISEDVALVSGFQAPVGQMEQLAPTMQYIMTSLRFIEPLPLQRYQESNEGAFTGYVPQGWSVRASMRRSPDSSRTPLTHLLAADPTGTISLEVPPPYEQFTEQMNPMMMLGGGGIRYMPVQTAAQYLQRFVIPRIQQQYVGAQIESIEHRADLSEHETMEAARADHFGFGTVSDVASVTYTSRQNGVLYRTKDFMQINHIRAAATWTAKITGIMRAPAGQFEEQEASFMGMVESIQPNKQWQQREEARSDQYFMQAQQRLAHVQQRQVVAIQNLHQVQIDIAENMRADINRRNASFSALQQDMDRIIAGYQYVYDPIDQQVYDVPVGAGQLWGGDGYVYRTDSGLTPPKIGLHRLEPLG